MCRISEFPVIYVSSKMVCYTLPGIVYPIEAMICDMYDMDSLFPLSMYVKRCCLYTVLHTYQTSFSSTIAGQLSSLLHSHGRDQQWISSRLLMVAAAVQCYGLGLGSCSFTRERRHISKNDPGSTSIEASPTASYGRWGSAVFSPFVNSSF